MTPILKSVSHYERQKKASNSRFKTNRSGYWTDRNGAWAQGGVEGGGGLRLGFLLTTVRGT